MKFIVERNQEYLEKLKLILNKNYHFTVNEIKPASRGVDGETWIIFTTSEKVFVKIDYSNNNDKFLESLKVIELLNKKGLTFINEIIKTKRNKSYIKFNNRTLVVFKYIDGKINYNYPYLKLMKLLIEIYKLNITNKVPKEDFKIKQLIKSVNKNILKAKENLKLNELLNNYQENINEYISCLQKYYKKINKKALKVITHGDACVNVMVGEQISLIDWDGALIAPIERDCWFFMDYKHKIKNINNLLKNNGINYEISNDMLAYYAYKSALIYLNDDIEKYLSLENEDILSDIKDIFEGWVFKKISATYKRKI